MWLVLCDASDASAVWAYQGLQARGLVPLVLLTGDMLANSPRWEHRLRGDQAGLRFQLGDGRIIDGEQVRGVLNRLNYLPLGRWKGNPQQDQDYVQQELFAFYLSWLYGLKCPVINRPTPQGLSGQWRQESQWAWLAHSAGLPVPVYRHSSHDGVDETRGQSRLVRPGAGLTTVIVAGAYAAGAAAPASIVEGCRRLGRLANTELLGVQFSAGPSGEWVFAGATPLPDLQQGGTGVLDILAYLLVHGL